MGKIHALLAQDVDGKSIAAMRELDIGDLPDAGGHGASRVLGAKLQRCTSALR